MIRSGEHMLWDAHLELVRRDAFRIHEVGEAFRRVGRAIGVSVAQAAAGLALLGRAYSEHMECAAKQLQEAVEADRLTHAAVGELGLNWTANRTTPPKTPAGDSEAGA